jgi:antitoxin (DNA-binding transcriptional repressor) of toxin-antitoxin stability system
METVGIREFREKLAEYLESTAPVAITRHGETIGFYIPARRKRTDEEKAALERAAAQLDKLLADRGAMEDELVEEFKRLRRQKRK